MASKKWIFAGRKKRQEIVLEHNRKTGNLYLFLNGGLFIQKHLKKKESKVIDFFIDDELCQIIIRYVGKEYHYSFVVNKDSTSQYSKSRKKKESDAAKFSYKFLGALLLLIVIIPTFFLVFSNWNEKRTLQSNGRLTKGSIIMTGIYSRGEHNTFYTFMAGGKEYTGGANLYINDRGETISKAGMPVNIGDEFQVLYLPGEPETNKMLFDSPTYEQLKKYHQLAYEKCYYKKEEKFNTSDLMKYCECLINYTYEEYGLDGLSMIYYQDESFIVNWSHNSLKYSEFIERKSFKNKELKCFEEFLEEDND